MTVGAMDLPPEGMLLGGVVLAGCCTLKVIPLVVKRRLNTSVISIPRAGSPASTTPPSNIPSGGRSIAPTVIYHSFIHGGTTSGPAFGPRRHPTDCHRW